MVFVAELARLAGRLDDADGGPAPRRSSARSACRSTYRGDRWPQLLDAMRVDKKSRGDTLRFVVLDGLARPAILEGPDPALLAAAYAEVAG